MWVDGGDDNSNDVHNFISYLEDNNVCLRHTTPHKEWLLIKDDGYLKAQYTLQLNENVRPHVIPIKGVYFQLDYLRPKKPTVGKATFIDLWLSPDILSSVPGFIIHPNAWCYGIDNTKLQYGSGILTHYSNCTLQTIQQNIDYNRCNNKRNEIILPMDIPIQHVKEISYFW